MLTEQFLVELFKLSFLKKQILEVLREHVKYQYLPDEIPALKKILKAIIATYGNTNNLPTFGIISQFYPNDIDVQDYLSKIKAADIPDTEEILRQLEEYIKLSRYQLMFEKAKDLYNSGKQKESIDFVQKESEEIVNFSITQNTSYFTKVFEDYNETVKQKQEARDRGDFDRDKVPSGITPLDEDIYGGFDKGDTVYILGRSGSGKSTLLKHIGVYDCRLGYDVLHVQLEGSKDEAIDKYTQCWNGQDYMTVKYGSYNFNEKEVEKINNVIAQMASRQRDIYVYAFEMFDEPTCRDIRDLIIKYQKEKGKLPDVVLIDSLDLLHPGDGQKYGVDILSIKMKKENSAKKLKNICTEFKTIRIIVVDQAEGIEKEKWNSSDFVMTRHNVSNSKNIVNSFSYVYTLNQTEAEEKNCVLRIYEDKLRNYHSTDRVKKIATNFAHGRFFDNARTKELNESSGVESKVRKLSNKKTDIKEEEKK